MVDPVALTSAALAPASANLAQQVVFPTAAPPVPSLSLVDCSGSAGSALESTVCTASGPAGLVMIGIYSFLIAFVLPLPSEIVLAPVVSTGTLQMGLPYELSLAVVILVSATGKAVGSVFAFHIGQEAKQSGPVIRFLRRSRFDVVEWSERQTVQLARRFGYVGLALALCVPGFPDTLSIYAFTVLEEDYLKFALATFAGSAGRLLLFLGGFHVLLSV